MQRFASSLHFLEQFGATTPAVRSIRAGRASSRPNRIVLPAATRGRTAATVPRTNFTVKQTKAPSVERNPEPDARKPSTQVRTRPRPVVQRPFLDLGRLSSSTSLISSGKLENKGLEPANDSKSGPIQNHTTRCRCRLETVYTSRSSSTVANATLARSLPRPSISHSPFLKTRVMAALSRHHLLTSPG